MNGVGDGGSTIEERIGVNLRETEGTLATAESCTGGLVASLVTDVPGASDYFDRGVVTYAYDAKRELLGVTREALDANLIDVIAPALRAQSARFAGWRVTGPSRAS